MKKILLILFVAAMSSTSQSNAASVGTGGAGTAFSKGSVSLGLVLGSGSAFNDNYLILGAGVGYYLVRGLEVGIDLQYWASGDPSITQLSPQVRYVFTQAEVVKPYIGAFYRRTFYGDYKGFSIDDLNSYGTRAGAYFSTDNRVYIGGGIVYEKYQDCAQLVDCSSTYPEILFQVSF